MSKDRRHLHSVPPPNERQEVAVSSKSAPAVQTVELPELLAPPSSLTKQELQVWGELRLEYGAELREDDRTLFGKLVSNETTYRDSMEKVRSVGSIIKAPSGYPIQNPYLAIANKAEERALRILVQLGLTPLARGRVKASKAKVLRTNPFAGLKSL